MVTCSEPIVVAHCRTIARPRGRPATLTDETALVMGRRVDVGGRGGVRVGLAEFVWRFVEVSKPLPTLPPVPRLSR